MGFDLTYPMFNIARKSPYVAANARSLKRCAYGFTLIELLVVMAVILILASITFGISRGVQGAQARAKAQGELAVLAQALESFKLRHGDYPWITGTTPAIRNQSLTNALTGRKIMLLEAPNRILGGFLADTAVETAKRSVFIDITRFSTMGTGETMQIIDPWGNAYEYHYKTSGTNGNAWDRFGYFLYSRGPSNKTLTVQANGQITERPNDIAGLGVIIAGQ
jgi:prepilin-type N-terminal cleavage/methylation domain-containing protein